MKHLKPPSPLSEASGVFSVFLAGSIEMGEAEDWQVRRAARSMLCRPSLRIDVCSMRVLSILLTMALAACTAAGLGTSPRRLGSQLSGGADSVVVHIQIADCDSLDESWGFAARDLESRRPPLFMLPFHASEPPDCEIGGELAPLTADGTQLWIRADVMPRSSPRRVVTLSVPVTPGGNVARQFKEGVLVESWFTTAAEPGVAADVGPLGKHHGSRG